MRRRLPTPNLLLLLALLLVVLPSMAACRQPFSRASADARLPEGTAYDPSQYPGGALLTNVDWLAAHLHDPELRIIDASTLRDFRAGHIPGAVHLWWQDTIEVYNDVYGMLVGADGRAKLIREAGIGPQSQVVVYDADGGRYAARILWMLNAVGFQQVSILNGGRQAWSAASQPMTKATSTPPSGALDQTLNYDVLVSEDELRQHLDDGSFTIVDNRTPDERRETWFGRLRLGAIPGAVLLPWSDLTQRAQTPYYGAPEQLSAMFTHAGVTPDRTIVVYGLDGIEAAQTYVALKLLGYPKVRVYDGSWAQWGANAGDPIMPLPTEEGGEAG